MTDRVRKVLSIDPLCWEYGKHHRFSSRKYTFKKLNSPRLVYILNKNGSFGCVSATNMHSLLESPIINTIVLGGFA